MDRLINYPGQIPLETDLLNTNRNALVALAAFAQDIFGTSTVVGGLACGPTSPATMSVQIGAGTIYSLQNLDNTAYSSLAADTTHQVMKQGVELDATNLSCPAPATAGFSVNYLIEAAYQDVDDTAVTLPYYNASNPTQAYSGPANSGTSQATMRRGTVALVAKPGIAAATGTQITPAADAGYVGLWVITVANGQTSITSANVSEYAGAPFIASISSVMTQLASRAAGLGSALVGFAPFGLNAVGRAVQDKLRDTVNVKDFGAVGDGVTDDTAAVQAAVNYAVSLAQALTDGGSPLEPAFRDCAHATVGFPSAKYYLPQLAGISIPVNTYLANIDFESDYGAILIGNGTTAVDGTNVGFNFSGGARKNKFRKLVFMHFGTPVELNTSNVNECMVEFEWCRFLSNATGVDTMSYASSRSTMVSFSHCLFGDTTTMYRGFTDHTSFQTCWFYPKVGSLTAPFYLSGDGMVTFDNCFFIPHGTQVSPVQNSRWIDVVCDSANSTPGDRSIKGLKVTNCRLSLESARPFIWFFDNNAALPSGANQVCSIVVEDTYVGGTGGNPVVTLIQGYPGSISLRNVKGLACPHIVDANATGAYGGTPNPNVPVPSVPGTINPFTIMIDEATRLAQSNSNNAAALIDPLLEPFLVDTTNQTSKYRRSIQCDVNYRRPAVAAPSAGTGMVKVTIPVFFDSGRATPSRDLLQFTVITVSDANGPASSNPSYGAIARTEVAVIGGNVSGTTTRRIVSTVVQDAKGGVAFGTSAAPTIFWGTGDTGSADISPTTAMGSATNITIVWPGFDTAYSWAYIIPNAGLRENYQPLMQQGVW